MKRSTLPLVFGVRLGTDMLEAVTLAGWQKATDLVASPAVGHNPLDLDVEACVLSGRSLEKVTGQTPLIAVHNLAERRSWKRRIPGSVVDKAWTH